MVSSRLVRLRAVAPHRRSSPRNGLSGPSLWDREAEGQFCEGHTWTEQSHSVSPASATRGCRSERMSKAGEAPVTEELIDNTDQGRFELRRGRDLVGWLEYTHLRPNRYSLQHTEVEASQQH